ncbi:ATP-binding protein [Edaphobacter sp.]|uniref:ATP-binding protein n=1 Tax=Edaphobacter sp. TaxID=1934404 RepID=UPI002DBD8D21|nr:RNA-binding domain-containing protein [Edaphobacter sp.]HEU5340218.1 RNA-binding domain-containing protein [Edaphobacter sp.]
MSVNRSSEYLSSLLRELCKLPQETEWVEFKQNVFEAQQIGEYISALSNSAALVGKACAYLAWGIQNDNHTIVGTSFRPKSEKVGNEELENWLLRMLSPKIHFHFYELFVESHAVIILEIERAARHPVAFSGHEYIRVGSYKKRLKDFPEKERALWRIFDEVPFESNTAADNLTEEDVITLLDVPSYFELVARSLPESRKATLSALQSDNLINPNGAGKWDITNLGAVLFAKRLDDFGPLKRKAIRVIQYRGNSRVETLKEQDGHRGYGNGFEGLIGYVNGLLPTNEVIRQALRQDVSMYPELAIRELVANALIHQDFSITGSGPMVEIFDDRIELTNPGEPLVKTERFIDSPPRSRNEALASLMRRIGVCEERGSGWDKVVFLTEVHQLPAPLTEAIEGNTRIVLFAHKPLKRMDKDDRVRALYLHACLRYVNREHMTNASVRARFAIEDRNTATASRLIREAVEAGVIFPHDSSAAPKLMRYIPSWAVSEGD